MTRLLSVTAAAEQLDCSRGHVYGLIAAGQLRPVEIKTTGSTRTKTRVRLDDLEAYIDAMTRGELSGAVRVAAERRRVVHAGDRHDRERAVYSTPEAAAYAEVHVDTIAGACRDGRLHGTRATTRGRWSIEHGCLRRWLDDQPCQHQDGGGRAEVRCVDGT